MITKQMVQNTINHFSVPGNRVTRTMFTQPLTGTELSCSCCLVGAFMIQCGVYSGPKYNERHYCDVQSELNDLFRKWPKGAEFEKLEDRPYSGIDRAAMLVMSFNDRELTTTTEVLEFLNFLLTITE